VADDPVAERSSATSRPAGSRDAWAVDGFAPLPGDTVQLPGPSSGPAPANARTKVQTVYLCAESNGLDLVRWSWIVLEDGRLLEIAPRGCALYDPPNILPHGSGAFLELAAQDGALVRFEERVRAGVWEARPVRLTLGGRRWRLTSTGTVIAQRLGPAPTSPWGQLRTGAPSSTSSSTRSLSMSTRSTARRLPDTWAGPDGRPPSDELDIYFTFVGQTSGKTDPDLLGLGVWMADICLAFGCRLGDSPAAAGLSRATPDDSPTRLA
jgi:hypothetical protein